MILREGATMFGKRKDKQVVIADDGFTYRKNRYAFGDVRHLSFVRVMTAQRLNLVKIGEADSAELLLTMADGKELEISVDESTIFMGWNRDKQQEIQGLIGFYAYVSQCTFERRLAYYEGQIGCQRCFEYDGCRFYPGEKIVCRRQEFPIGDSRFLKRYGVIEMRKKDYGFWDKVKPQLPFNKLPCFVTLTDTDVIFYLLEKHFGLTWDN